MEKEKENAIAKARIYLQKLNALQNQDFPKESTARELERYIKWYPKMFKSETINQLKSMATELRKELPSLEEIMKSDK